MSTVVRMAYVHEWPWSYRDADGLLTGFDVAIAYACAARLGWEIEATEIKWDDIVPALAGGEFDLFITGLGILPERTAVGDHSTPLYTVSSKAFVLPGNPLSIHSIDDMRRQRCRIGAIKGAGEHGFIRERLLDDAVEDRVIGFPDESALWGALDREDIDVALFAEYAGLGYLREHPGAKFEMAVPFHWPELPPTFYWYPKGSQDLQREVDQVLGELKAEGTLRRIFEDFGYPGDSVVD